MSVSVEIYEYLTQADHKAENIYLNEYDQEMARRGVPVIRYADDIVVLVRSPRAAQRLLEGTR